MEECRGGRLGLILCTIVFASIPFAAVAVFTGPQDTSVLRGASATLYCRNPDHTGTGITQWSEGGDVFANEGGVFGSNTKYDNFDVITSSSTPTTQLDLRINSAEISDEGTYECQITPDRKTATLTVEIEGSLDDISVDGDSSGNPIILRASEPSVLRCTARGFRPAVTLEWYKNSVQVTTGVNPEAPTPNGDAFDTSGTLTFTPTRQDNEANLECRTTGQVVAPAKTASLTLNVQYVPVVSVGYANEVITCSSDANPLATNHKIILNGTQVVKEFTTSQGSQPFTPVDGCTVISCNATNTVGTGTATFTDEVCLGYVEPTTTPATKSTPPTKSPSAGQDLGTGAIIGIAVGVLVVVCFVIIGIIICFKKKIFCFDNNKTSNSTSPKKQPSAKNADMIRNQPEVRQSVHNYDDEPKKPRVPRSNSGKPAAAAAAVPPEKEALRQNPPPHSKDRDHQNYPMDSRDGGPEHGGQAGINYADLEFQNRQGATNGHGRVHPREDEPTQYASILV
ncbi:kin of IRRE-like protein 3 isoform X3 [Acanthaster planci]|uniref:Kin of IRRE-like protein 3 isoform X3 n=1 Tax=Acanthaster planci TaxID=133434 RepID=A0A8B7ZWF2_ACAPL|nr:kin of IRRE-like protein 3 isoform X3 [Acanthaster planci]